MVALQQGDASRAVEILEPVRLYDHAPSAEFWPAYIRGQAYLRLRDGQRAAAEFQSIIDHRGEVPVSALYALAHLGRARASVLTRDDAGARKWYEAFLAFWKDGDLNLPPLKEGRVEYARLSGTESPVASRGATH